MFLIFINDITTGITSHIRLFADDCIIYRPIISQNDHTIIQNYFDTLATWVQLWQMQLNIDKCYTLQFTRSPHSSSYEYTLNTQPLLNTGQQTYLGILIDRTLTWLPHIKVISAKATNMLNLLRCNLSDYSKQTKSTAYLSF